MKNLLNYYYNIYPDTIYEKSNYYYFFIDDIKYYFVLFDRDINELNNLVEITNELYYKNIKVHTFIKNKDNTFHVKNNDDNYVLLRVNDNENEEIDLYDILKFNNLKTINNSKTDIWVERWGKTVDAFEKEMTELNKEFPELLKVFNYYVGLAENAISYIGNINVEDDTKLYLSHKRIKFPLTKGMLFNPLSFEYDYKVRDLSEYIKEGFFFNNLEIDEILNFIDQNTKYYSLADIKLLFGRLLFPTYYFDIFEESLNGKSVEKEFNRIVSLSKNYEDFLKELYHCLKVKYNVEGIDWIVNSK